MSQNDESNISSRLYSLLRTPTPRSPPFTGPTCRYATSSTRDEPFSRDVARPGTMSDATGRPAAAVAPPIQVQREVAPGVLQDGTLTVNHPYVDRYVDRLAASYQAATGQTVAGPSTLRRPEDMAGVATLGRAEDVSTVLQLGEELNELQSACVFALAALKVYTDQHHPIHFALWGSSVQNRTAAVVEKIYYHQPALIASPVCWTGTRTQLWLLRIQQLLAFPPERVEKTPSRMELRKRKARAQTHARATPARASRADKGKAVDRSGLVGAEEQAARKQPPLGAAAPQLDSEVVVAAESTLMDAAGTTTPQEEVARTIEVAPGVLLVARGASGVAGNKALEATSAAAPLAPTRRSSRQALKRGAASGSPTAQPALASTSATPTPAILTSPGELFPSRGSSTAVSAVSEDTAVGEERAPVRGKKRKVSEPQVQAPQAKTEVPAPVDADEEPPRKTRRTAAPVPDAGVKSQTKNAPRTRRSGGRKRK